MNGLKSAYGETSGSYQVPQGPAVDRIGGVPSTLQGHNAAIERLSGRVGELLAHLESGGVLRPSPPEATGRGDNVPAPVVCSLAGEIQRGTASVEAIRSQVEDVLKRLDI